MKVHSHGVRFFQINGFVDCTLHFIDLGVVPRCTLLLHDVYNSERTREEDLYERGL